MIGQTVGSSWREATLQLQADGNDASRLEAEILLRHLLERSTTWLYAHPEVVLTPDEAKRFRHLVNHRLAGTPIAYLTGRREFWSLPLETSPVALIPRPETELLVELALELKGFGPQRAIDLGTGTGAIAVALAKERPDWFVSATDQSLGVLALAARNGARFASGRVELSRSDWWGKIPTDCRYDLIISNPPYIAERDPHLTRGDLRREPRSALTSGTDGLDDIRKLLLPIKQRLRPQGWALVEHGAEQGAAVRELFGKAGLTMIKTVTDLAGLERVTLGQTPDQ